MFRVWFARWVWMGTSVIPGHKASKVIETRRNNILNDIFCKQCLIIPTKYEGLGTKVVLAGKKFFLSFLFPKLEFSWKSTASYDALLFQIHLCGKKMMDWVFIILYFFTRNYIPFITLFILLNFRYEMWNILGHLYCSSGIGYFRYVL